MTTKQTRRLQIVQGLTPEEVQQRLMSVWRQVKPDEPFPGFDFNQQQQMVKSLQMAPAWTVFGMDNNGIPRPLGGSELAPAVANFTAPVGVDPTVVSPPIGETWTVTGIFAVLTTGAGPTRRARLNVVESVSGLPLDNWWSDTVQSAGMIESYVTQPGASYGVAGGFAGTVISWGIPAEGIEVVGPDFLVIVTDGLAVGDAWATGTARYRRKLTQVIT